MQQQIAAHGHEKVVRLLLKRDDVEADFRDKYGQTPLIWAATRGHEKVVQMLLQRDDVGIDSETKYYRTRLARARAGYA